MFFTKLFFILSMALAAAAMATPRMGHDVHRRHALKARLAAESPAAPAPGTTVVPRKRSVKRCKTKGPSSSSTLASSTPSASSSADAQPSAPVNVGGAPPVFPSSSAAQPSSEPAPAPSKPSPQPKPAPSSEPAKESPTPKPAPAPPASSAAPPAPSAAPPASGSGNPLLTEQHTGDATFYATGLGSCGIVNTDTDFIAAASHILYDEFPGYSGGNPNNNPICGMKATATYQGKQVTITITDRCAACAEFDLDFSPAAFNTLADPSLGRLHGMQWKFD